jgi:hypothetical protein
MPGNKGVAYVQPGQVEVHNIEYPTFELKDGPTGLAPRMATLTWAAGSVARPSTCWSRTRTGTC